MARDDQEYPRPTVADAMARIATWTDLPEGVRRDLLSALRTCSRIIGQPPQNIPADPAHLNTVLFDRSPAAVGISASSWSAILSDPAPMDAPALS